VVLGVLVARRVLLAHGIVGLVHDWGIPPSAAQNVAFAQQIFNGWYTWALGLPVVYPTEYPLRFSMGILASIGADGALLSKMLVAGVPALAFVSAAYLCSQLRIKPWAACVAAAFYALNPVMLNKLVSGQSSYLFGYAVMPAALGCLVSAQGKKHWFRIGIETGALLALTAVQIQLGIFAYGILVVAALCLGSVPAGRRLSILGVATLCFLLAEMPTVIGTIYGVSSLQVVQIFRENLAWLAANSVHPFDALRLSGYLTGYDVMAVRGFVSWWTIAGFIVAAGALWGYASAPRWLAGFGCVCGVVTLLFVCGVYSPVAVPLMWLFAHVRFMEAFRELYHAMGVLALVYAVGIGFFFQSTCRRWSTFGVRVLMLLALGIYVAPMLSGNVSGWLQTFGYVADMKKAYAIVSREPERSVWFPMDQPLAYKGVGAGVDPMFVTKFGSLWLYTLVWPFSSVDMAARSHHWTELQAALEQLSVGNAVERRLFSSRLARFVPPKTNAMSAYLQQPVPLLQLPQASRDAVSRDTDVLSLREARPLAFSTDRVALMPYRLDALQFVPADAEPVPYGSHLPRSTRYVAITEPEDGADEALASLPQLPIPTASVPDHGFVQMQFWWWYRPEYAESPSGWLTVGKHVVSLPIRQGFSRGILELSLQASPVGGRLLVVYGAHRWTIDTNGSSRRVFSRVFDLGGVVAGSRLQLATLDPYDDVAILSIRLLEQRQYRSALSHYALLLRRADKVIKVRSIPLVYGAPTVGRSQNLGDLNADRDYLLQVTYVSPRPEYVEVVGPDGYVIARRLVAPSSRGSLTLKFSGFRGRFAIRFRPGGGRVVGWRLVSAARVDPVRAERNPPKMRAASWAPDGSASFSDHEPILVLNESFSSNWEPSVAVKAHLPSIFDTNVYIAASGGPVNVTRQDEPRLRVAYVLGCCIIAFGLASLAVGSKWSASRRA
jgi:hypothetical protein